MSNTLQKAIEERDAFLKEHPNMQKFQDELDDYLSRCPQDARLEVIALMMTGKLIELQSKLVEFTATLKGVSNA